MTFSVVDGGFARRRRREAAELRAFAVVRPFAALPRLAVFRVPPADVDLRVRLVFALRDFVVAISPSQWALSCVPTMELRNPINGVRTQKCAQRR
jgi:hypothetical protein